MTIEKVDGQETTVILNKTDRILIKVLEQLVQIKNLLEERL